MEAGRQEGPSLRASGGRPAPPPFLTLASGLWENALCRFNLPSLWPFAVAALEDTHRGLGKPKMLWSGCFRKITGKCFREHGRSSLD